MKTESTSPGSSALNRRQFIASAAVPAVGLTLLQPGVLWAADDAPKTRLGLIGCGGRGQWIAGLFAKHGGYEIAAVADYFADRADEAGGKFGVPAGRRFVGLDGYRRLLEGNVDAVAIESPPYFHPEQAAAAVAAGKHVYVAKPVAVDVPGCQSIEASGRRASEKKLAFLVDFQAPTHPLFQEFIRRLRRGELGRIVSAEAAYQTGLVGAGTDAARRADPRHPELRLRSWVSDRTLSGDIITEQNIHCLDMACRLLDAAPLRARGAGGKRRDYVGDCWDHFSVLFDFPDDVLLTFSSKQVGFGLEDILARVYGTIGCVDAHYDGKVVCRTKEDGAAGTIVNLYTTGAEANIATLRNQIVRGDFANPTVALGVRSNLTTILGRTAAYRNGEVTWAGMMKAAEKWEFDARGLKS